MTPIPSSATISPLTIDQAADWLVRLHAGELDAGGRRALDAWRASAPEHETAWRAAESLATTLGAIPAGIGINTLANSHRARRRKLAKGIALLLLAPSAGWLGWRLRHGGPTTDYRTATGERRAIHLADGSRLHLNTASSADVRFDAGQRRIVLHGGEILVETAPDAARPPRPFLVDTGHGQIRALGTRFIVRRDGDGRSHVAVLEHAVEIRPHRSDAPRRLEAGQAASFDEHAVGPASPLPVGIDAWQDGNLIADRQRLADFLAELARHRPGLLRCAPEIADLRISGVFQLADTDRILAILQDNLPIAIRRHTRYWVNVLPRDPAL